MSYANINDRIEYDRAYRLKNKDKIRRYHQEYYAKNKDKIKEKVMKYRIANNETIADRKKKYRKENKEKRNQKLKHMYSSNMTYRLKVNLRNRLYDAVRNKIKKGSAVKHLGCSLDFFIEYIESQFTDGMSWDNRGEWHLDHIVPLAKFNLEDIEEFLKAVHYTNIQPLWAKDNLRKGSK